MGRILGGIFLILAGWIGPTLRLIQVNLAPGDTVAMSANTANALCHSLLGQVGQSVSPAVSGYCSQAGSVSVLATLAIAAGAALLVWGLLPYTNIELRRRPRSRSRLRRVR